MHLSNPFLRTVIAVATFVALSPASGADNPPAPAAGQGPRAVAETCRADAARLCADVEKGGGRRLACLREHDAQLSPACRDSLADMTTNRKNIAPK